MPKRLAIFHSEWWAPLAIAALGLIATTSVVALGLAHMALPDELAAAERVRASGYGGKNRGHFALGDYRGAFTRIDEIGIESLHGYEGSRLSSQTPVGYLLSHDSQPVGALELTDSEPTFVLRDGLAPTLGRATLIAALGLSVLRDPASSALGD